jgi:hypothetical protein
MLHPVISHASPETYILSLLRALLWRGPSFVILASRRCVPWPKASGRGHGWEHNSDIIIKRHSPTSDSVRNANAVPRGV